MPEPQGRGTWSILWSCLATIFICTWSDLHLDVPRRHGRWYLLFRKLGWMLLATIAPELFLFAAADKFFVARSLSRHLQKVDRGSWTQTHIQFACVGGFSVRGKEDEELKLDDLRNLIESESIDEPPLSAEELKSRSKSDWVIKFIAILQILWFVIQTLLRTISHFRTTAIEIMTVAFVLCSVFIYGFSLYLPQNVEYPVILEVRSTEALTNEVRSRRISGDSQTAHDGRLMSPRTEPPKVNKTGTAGGPIEDPKAQRLPSKYVLGWAALRVPDGLLGLFACGFGAIHCLGWNWPFPTAKEQVAWRVCSAAITGLPVVISIFSRDSYPLFETASDKSWCVGVFLYILGRITIIVLAFMALRAMPVDTFQTVNWTNYFPHFAV